MSKADIEQKILELKHEYIRIQGDIEKLESVGRTADIANQQLIKIEKELDELRKQL